MWQCRASAIDDQLVEFTRETVRSLLRTAAEVEALLARAT
jgi:hypothetical protein